MTATYHHLLFKFFIDIGMFTFVYLLICSHILINVLVCFLIYNSKKKSDWPHTSKIASNNLFLSVTLPESKEITRGPHKHHTCIMLSRVFNANSNNNNNDRCRIMCSHYPATQHIFAGKTLRYFHV